jgi:very-short-patch-repair endonuclease
VRLVSGRRIGLTSGSVDELASAIAGAQRGYVSHAQLLSAGADRRAIWRRVRNGRMIRRHAIVYAVGHAPKGELADETAALLACGPNAVLSHHSAATLWGVRPGAARPIHVTLPHAGRGKKLDGVIVHRSTTLAPPDVRIHKDLPVTSPARAMLDIAATLPDKDLGYVLDEAFAKKLLTDRDLDDILRRAGRHPGSCALRRVIQTRAGTLSESKAQRRLLELIRQADLPLPETECPILDYRADLMWRDLRLIVEVDGYQTHGTQGRFERDRRRDARLFAAGFVVIRFTATQIEQEPFAVIARLAQAIALAQMPAHPLRPQPHRQRLQLVEER